MNTKLSNKELQRIQNEFDDIFSFQDEKDKVEVDAHVIMAKFLSKIQEVADEKGILRKELAESIGTSASYLTQLFRGHKLMNLLTVAKLQRALDIKFEINIEGRDNFAISADEEAIAEHLDKWFINRNKGEFFKVVRNFTIPPSDDGDYRYDPSNRLTKKLVS